MTSLKNMSNKLYAQEWGRIVISAIVSFFIIAVVFIWLHPVFMTIDDARLRYVYAGYATGEPESSFLFSYFPYSFLVSKLYTAMPGIPWYAFCQFFLIGLSTVMIGKTIYKIAFRKKLRLGIAVSVHLFVYMSFCMISTVLMHFEITGIMCGSAAVVMLCGYSGKEDTRRQKAFDLVLCSFCLFASIGIQYNTFYASCCFVLVALAYQLFRAISEKEIKRFLLFAISVTLIVGTVFGLTLMCERKAKDTPEWKTYYSYNRSRVSFWDYPHITYSEDPQLFESIGWTENFYQLTDSMYFMDKRFNKEAIEQFTNRVAWIDIGENYNTSTNIRSTLGDLWSNNRIVRLQITEILIALTITIASLLKKNKRKQSWQPALAALLCELGTVFLIFFLAGRGRLPLRAWLACVIPCSSILAVLLLSAWNSDALRISKCKKRILGVSFLTVLAIWFGSILYIFYGIKVEDWGYRADCNHNVLDMERYAIEHPDNVYVYDLFGAQNYNVFKEYKSGNGKPTNAFVWGSSYIYTPTYYKQLALNGRSELLSEDLYDDNVYFITRSDNYYKDQLERVLLELFPETVFTEVDRISSKFIVYKISK